MAAGQVSSLSLPTPLGQSWQLQVSQEMQVGEDNLEPWGMPVPDEQGEAMDPIQASYGWQRGTAGLIQASRGCEGWGGGAASDGNPTWRVEGATGPIQGSGGGGAGCMLH